MVTRERGSGSEVTHWTEPDSLVPHDFREVNRDARRLETRMRKIFKNCIEVKLIKLLARTTC